MIRKDYIIMTKIQKYENEKNSSRIGRRAVITITYTSQIPRHRLSASNPYMAQIIVNTIRAGL